MKKPDIAGLYVEINYFLFNKFLLDYLIDLIS